MVGVSDYNKIIRHSYNQHNGCGSCVFRSIRLTHLGLQFHFPLSRDRFMRTIWKS